MVNEVRNEQKKEVDQLKTKLTKVEKEKKDHMESTSKVIEQLTMLSVQKDDQMQNLTMDMSMNFSVNSDEMEENGPKSPSKSPMGKRTRAKEQKKEAAMRKQIEDMERKIYDLQKQLRDTSSEVSYYKRKEAKWSESEQDFIKRIYILEEFMFRSHSVIQRRAARHMKTLRKAMNLDNKIFDILMKKQDWSLKLEDNKKQLTNSIKELEEFSKSLGGLNNMELQRLRSKINEDQEAKEEDNEPDDDEEIEEPHRSMSITSPADFNRLSNTSDNLNNTLDLGDEYSLHNSAARKKTNDSPIPSENPEFEDYLTRLD